MSFILDALTRGQVLRGRKTAALAHGAAASPALAWTRRRTMWRVGALAVAGACTLVVGLSYFRAKTTPSRAAPPAPVAAASHAPTQPASVHIPAMAPFPKQQVASFSPPTTLSQPLPPPGPVVRGAIALAPSLDPPRVVPDDVKPLSHLPGDLQAMVGRMKVRLHVYAPQRRHRFVMVEDRQLREGDELFAGVRLDEITEAGMVLRHKQTRVLAPAPTGR